MCELSPMIKLLLPFSYAENERSEHKMFVVGYDNFTP